MPPYGVGGLGPYKWGLSAPLWGWGGSECPPMGLGVWDPISGVSVPPYGAGGLGPQKWGLSARLWGWGSEIL